MYERRSTALLLPLLLSMTTACSDENADATGAHVSTGLPVDAKLSSFDDNDAKAACQALNDGANELISDSELVRAQCASTAIRTTAKLNQAKTEVTLDIAKCDELTKTCQSDPVSYGVTAQQARNDSDCGAATANERVMQCQATVADYEACISKLLDRAKQTLAKVTCGNSRELLESDGAATKVDPASVPACQAFLEQCPDIQIAVNIEN